MPFLGSIRTNPSFAIRFKASRIGVLLRPSSLQIWASLRILPGAYSQLMSFFSKSRMQQSLGLDFPFTASSRLQTTSEESIQHASSIYQHKSSGIPLSPNVLRSFPALKLKTQVYRARKWFNPVSGRFPTQPKRFTLWVSPVSKRVMTSY